MDRKTGGLRLRSPDMERQTHQQNDLKQIPDLAESRFIHTFVKLKVIDVVRLVLFSVTGLRIGNIRRLSFFKRMSNVGARSLSFLHRLSFFELHNMLLCRTMSLFYTDDIVLLISLIGEVRHMLQHPQRMIDAVRYTDLPACKFDRRDPLALVHDPDIVDPFKF